MKKRRLRVPVIAAAVLMALALGLTATAAVTGVFRNDRIVATRNDILVPSDAGSGGGPGMIAVSSPGGGPPRSSLAEMAESGRFKSDDWEIGEMIGGGCGIWEYAEWDHAEVLSRDPALRSRRVTREKDGAEKMEYTAENPANLLDTLTGRVTFDLSWMEEHYDYVPDANLSFVVNDKNGKYVGELFEALYAKKDGSGYVNFDIINLAQADYIGQNYILEGSYEAAYYYTNPDGHEFLVKMNEGNAWMQCRTSHTDVSLYGAYLTQEEVEDILDHLCLNFEG